jgi:hypothetical protein
LAPAAVWAEGGISARACTMRQMWEDNGNAHYCAHAKWTSPHKLIGHLHELWWWALDNVGVDGRLTGMSPVEIGLAAQWDGDPEEFVEALIYGGFIDRDGDELVLHDWYDYAGKLIGKRLEERERSRRRRQQAKKETETTAGETAEPTAGRPADDQRSTVGTVPYRTVPNSTIDSNSVAKRFDDDSIPMKS